ncbi:NADPH:quinone reductase [Nostocoides sp. HKS02]|uniref:NADPH:quinone reductase n=1 Tax=Nostocoides sp. HKS02 TaxID=1813880 RepID=UPI0012B49215|nr:NADPH:quinone reductase [Tetrasphaera sp. HKS02]QGN59223.1 zinc-binding dehydrogenase [Tetrasphaera sp. HKS02]
MKAIVYTSAGGPEVLHLVDRPIPEPGPGEVRVRIHVSGVNPTDWKRRAGGLPPGIAAQVPNQDGAGIIDAVGPGVPASRLGERVWIWEAAWQRPDGTAQEQVVLPERHAVPLPDHAPFALGAALGIPALTAHRTLTVAEGGPERLARGALSGKTVLVAGGAGAVGNAAIQLARWAGAHVITTVSGPAKAALALAAGADQVVNYRSGNAVEQVRAIAPEGVDLFVEVAPDANATLDHTVAAPNATIAFYADDGSDDVRLAIRQAMTKNLRWQGVLVYTVSEQAKAHAIAGVRAAVEDGALKVGESAGLPLHWFAFEDTAEAHAAVETGVVGKVLIEVAPNARGGHHRS